MDLFWRDGSAKQAVKFGYKIEILKSYKFKSQIIFDKYIKRLYDLRKQYSKEHLLNLISKLFMNSLYSKFGMKSTKSIVEIFDQNNENDKQTLAENFKLFGESIQDYIQLDHHLIIVRDNLLNYKHDEDKDLYRGLNVNVGIAAAITAGGRIYMSAFKNREDFNLYYTDTDNIVIDKPLSSNLIFNELGKFKLEYTIKTAFFYSSPPLRPAACGLRPAACGEKSLWF